MIKKTSLLLCLAVALFACTDAIVDEMATRPHFDLMIVKGPGYLKP